MFRISLDLCWNFRVWWHLFAFSLIFFGSPTISLDFLGNPWMFMYVIKPHSGPSPLTRSCLQLLFNLLSSRFQNTDSGTKRTAKDATDAKSVQNSTSPRPESNGRRPRPGFAAKPCKTKFEFYIAYPSNPDKMEMCDVSREKLGEMRRISE